MANPSLTVELANAAVEESPILFADLVRGLAATLTALRRTDDSVKEKGEDRIDWRVADVTSNSPIRATVEPTPGAHGRRVVEAFFEYGSKIRDGDFAGINRSLLNAFKELATPVDQGRLRVSLWNGSASLDIPLGLSHQIEAALAPEETIIGSVKGQLEFVNVHGAENVFRVYPPIGPNFVECRFPERLKPQATAAVGRNVRVSGKLHVRAGDIHPSSVEVKRIEIIPFDSELPSLLDIRGMAPEVTGALSSEDFVRSVRLAREEA